MSSSVSFATRDRLVVWFGLVWYSVLRVRTHSLVALDSQLGSVEVLARQGCGRLFGRSGQRRPVMVETMAGGGRIVFFASQCAVSVGKDRNRIRR